MKIREHIAQLRPRPHWTVTWPTTPDGAYTIHIRRADGVEDAVAQARAAHAPTNPGYAIDYRWLPEVWQIKPWPPRRVAGPDYQAIVPCAEQ